jgi:hypothetical protein
MGCLCSQIPGCSPLYAPIGGLVGLSGGLVAGYLPQPRMLPENPDEECLLALD